MMYLAVAVLLPVLPASKMAGAGSRQRKSALRSLYSVLEPETVSAKGRDDDDRYLASRDEEKIQKSFTLPAAGQKSLEIDNVWGSIEVVADTTDKVEMTVARTNRAESKEKLEMAKKQVTLDVTQDEGAVKLYVNGPFRCQCEDCRHSREDDGYRVKMDFKDREPRVIDLKLKT